MVWSGTASGWRRSRTGRSPPRRSVRPGDLPAPAGAGRHRRGSHAVAVTTGHLALHRRAALRAGETVLAIAGASGVGSAAVQLAVLAGARVIATADGQAKLDLCRDLGASVTIDHHADDVTEAVLAATDGNGADVVYGPVGGDLFHAAADASRGAGGCWWSASPPETSPMRRRTTSSRSRRPGWRLDVHAELADHLACGR